MGCTYSVEDAQHTTVSFSGDGSRIVSAGVTVRVWDAMSGECVMGPLKRWQRHGPHVAEVLSVSFSPDGSRIVSGSNDEKVHVVQ